MPYQELSDAIIHHAIKQKVPFTAQTQPLVNKQSAVSLKELGGQWLCEQDKISSSELIDVEQKLIWLEFGRLFMPYLPHSRLYKETSRGTVSYIKLTNTIGYLPLNETLDNASWHTITQWLTTLSNTNALTTQDEDFFELSMEDMYLTDDTDFSMSDITRIQEEAYESAAKMSLHRDDITKVQHKQAHSPNEHELLLINQKLLIVALLPSVVLNRLYPTLNVVEKLNPIIFSNNDSFNEFVLSEKAELEAKHIVQRLSDTQLLRNGLSLDAFKPEMDAKFQTLKQLCELKKVCNVLTSSLMVSYAQNDESPFFSLWDNVIAKNANQKQFQEQKAKILNYYASTVKIEEYLVQMGGMLKIMDSMHSDYFESYIFQCFQRHDYLDALYDFCESAEPFNYLVKSQNLISKENSLINELSIIGTHIERQYDEITLDSRIKSKLTFLNSQVHDLALHFSNIWLSKKSNKMSLENKYAVNDDLRALVALLKKTDKDSSLFELQTSKPATQERSLIMKVNLMLGNVEEGYSAHKNHQSLIRELILSLIQDENTQDLLNAFLPLYRKDFLLFQAETKQKDVKEVVKRILGVIKVELPSYDFDFFESVMNKSFAFLGCNFKRMANVEEALLAANVDNREPSLVYDLMLVNVCQVVLHHVRSSELDASPQKKSLVFSVQRYLEVLKKLASHLNNEDKNLITKFFDHIQCLSEDSSTLGLVINEFLEEAEKKNIWDELEKKLKRFEQYSLCEGDVDFDRYLQMGKHLIASRDLPILRLYDVEMTIVRVLQSLESPAYKQILSWANLFKTLDQQALLKQLVDDVKRIPVLKRGAIILPDTYRLGQILTCRNEYARNLSPHKQESLPDSPRHKNFGSSMPCFSPLNRTPSFSPTLFMDKLSPGAKAASSNAKMGSVEEQEAHWARGPYKAFGKC